MRRSFGYDDEPVWGDMHDDDDEGEEYEEEMSPDMFDMMQLDLESQHVNHQVMESALRMLEMSWCWRFRSAPTKLKMLDEAYTAMLRLVQNGDRPPGKSDKE